MNIEYEYSASPKTRTPSDLTTDEPLEGRALGVIRKLLGRPEAGWSCVEQRDAMLAVITRQSDVMALIKTGGGKSMLVVVPALLEPDCTTVVVLPLKSLMTDYK